MKTESQNGQSVQGTEDSEATAKNIRKWLERDLNCAVSCLTAIHSDRDLLDAMAVFMAGRFANHKAQMELKKSQPELPLQ